MSHENKSNSEYLMPLLADNLFYDLTPEARDVLAKIKKTKQFGAGENFFSAGETPCCIYVLHQGKAQISFLSESDPTDKRIVRLAEENEILGLTEAITNMPYKITAEAITPCLSEYFEREDFIGFLRSEPEVCFRLLQKLGLSFQKSYKNFQFCKFFE